MRGARLAVLAKDRSSVFLLDLLRRPRASAATRNACASLRAVSSSRLAIANRLHDPRPFPRRLQSMDQRRKRCLRIVPSPGVLHPAPPRNFPPCGLFLLEARERSGISVLPSLSLHREGPQTSFQTGVQTLVVVTALKLLDDHDGLQELFIVRPGRYHPRDPFCISSPSQIRRILRYLYRHMAECVGRSTSKRQWRAACSACDRLLAGLKVVRISDHTSETLSRVRLLAT